MKTPQETLKELKEFMETLRDFDTWKEWRNTDPIEPVQQAEWDDSHELNNVMNQMVDDVFPEFNLSKGVFDKLSSLDEWKEIVDNDELYQYVLETTQDLEPIDSGNSLHCHHAEYEFGNILYRLTWEIGNNNKPIIEFKHK
jgi:hypothetical protein